MRSWRISWLICPRCEVRNDRGIQPGPPSTTEDERTSLAPAVRGSRLCGHAARRAGRSVADVLGLVQLAPLLAARAAHAGHYREIAAGVGVSAAGHRLGGIDTGRCQR